MPCSRLLRLFLFPMSLVSHLTSIPSHRSPERLPPKHSFLLTRCAWFPYSVSAYLLRTSLSYTCLPQRGFLPSIALPKPSLYIYLGSYAMNTAWSVHYIVTYLNDDTACILFNLNLLDSPLQPGLLKVVALLLSRRSFIPLTLNSLCNQSLPGVVVEAPNTLVFLKTPFKNLCPSIFQVYVCLYPSQA